MTPTEKATHLSQVFTDIGSGQIKSISITGSNQTTCFYKDGSIVNFHFNKPSDNEGFEACVRFLMGFIGHVDWTRSEG